MDHRDAILRFANCEIDFARRELRRDDELVRVEPQVFDLLAYLIRNRDRAVGKGELFDAVWRGRIVSDATLSSRISAARHAIGDTGASQTLLKTAPRYGFRFVGAVVLGEASADAAGPVSEDGAEPPLAPGNAPLRQEVTFCRCKDGVHLATAAVGTGDTLVKAANWLNHITFDWESPLWSPLLKRLARRFRLVRYDGRGNGLSDWDVSDISFEAFVSDLETVVDALDLTRFSLFGISQGAAVAIAYTVRHPERVQKLVLLGAYAQGRNKRGSPHDLEQARAALSLMRLGWGDERSAFMQAFSSIYLPKGTPEQIRWYAELQRKTTSAENAIRIRLACDDIDVVDLLPQVHVPTLILHSQYDNIVPLAQGRLIAASIPNARFVMLESDNHTVLPGEPAWDRAVQEIEIFLS